MSNTDTKLTAAEKDANKRKKLARKEVNKQKNKDHLNSLLDGDDDDGFDISIISSRDLNKFNQD